MVGTGITLAVQTTLEALACIERAGRLFYVVSNPATETWLRRLNPAAVTLEDCYAEGKPRRDTYREMTRRILSAVRDGFHVCAVFYGHPGVLVHASHEAIRQARREGFPARMLPGISAEACLFADLGVNPGDAGWQSFEATDFVGRRRRFDPATPLLLWQAGVLGEASIRPGMSCRPERLRVLARLLRRSYPARHPVVLYEAAPFPICRPHIERTTLGRLPGKRVLPATTLYIPPRPARPVSRQVAAWLAE
ncbi:MAG: SAM-dependent methyltransferase [Planctomycetaceae bacterium]